MEIQDSKDGWNWFDIKDFTTNVFRNVKLEKYSSLYQLYRNGKIEEFEREFIEIRSEMYESI